MRHALAALALVLALAAGASAATAQERGPTVVELFTSQGCSSCPPADALLADLAGRDGILALSFHVDYWDYIGWQDPFASPAATQRQRDYARDFRLGYVYTPQMVVQGRRQMTGSDRSAVLEAIEKESAAPDLAVRIAGDRDNATAVLPADAGAKPATVWAVAFDRGHSNPVARGENRGRTLSHAHVVRDFRKIGAWQGRAAELPLPMAEIAAGHDAVAVLVQSTNGGAILGAAVLNLDR